MNTMELTEIFRKKHQVSPDIQCEPRLLMSDRYANMKIPSLIIFEANSLTKKLLYLAPVLIRDAWS